MQKETKIPGTDINVKDFQKWMRDTYGADALIGFTGKNKDGIDGAFGTKTKKAWDEFGKFYGQPQTTTPSSVLTSGSNFIPSSRAIPNSNDIRASTANKRLNSTTSSKDDLLNKLNAEYEAKTLGKDLADTKMLRNRGIADMIPTITGGAYGLGQLIKGNNLSKKLKPPKRVEQLLPNQQLATMLAKASVNSEVVDPKIKEEAIRAMTTNRELANEMARVGSGGDITAYSQNAQNNYMKSNDAVRKLASDSQADLYKNRAQLGSLINDKMSEDRDLYEDRLNEFNKIDYPEFVGARKYAADLTNTGMTNVMGALNNGVANAPILQGTKNIMSGYKARYASMSPAEKKVFATNYPKLAAKYEMEDKMPVGGVIVQPEIVDQPIQPQYLPQMPLGANWRQY
jgi:hypothetical protein